ncbi:MAG TPA: hypothetical protein VLU24_06525 [Mycobacterium sp.]|nr:hypothetical protein [Mycobacterium sp.]
MAAGAAAAALDTPAAGDVDGARAVDVERTGTRGTVHSTPSLGIHDATRTAKGATAGVQQAIQGDGGAGVEINLTAADAAAGVDRPAACNRQVALECDQPSLPQRAVAARVDCATLEDEVALGEQIDFAAESVWGEPIGGQVRRNSQITEVGFDGKGTAIAGTTGRVTGGCALEDNVTQNLRAGSGRNGDDAADAAITCADYADRGLQCTRRRLTDEQLAAGGQCHGAAVAPARVEEVTDINVPHSPEVHVATAGTIGAASARYDVAGRRDDVDPGADRNVAPTAATC